MNLYSVAFEDRDLLVKVPASLSKEEARELIVKQYEDCEAIAYLARCLDSDKDYPLGWAIA